MKPPMHVIAVFRRITGADGKEYYASTLDCKALSKLRQTEPEALMMPVKNLPEPLPKMIPGAKDDDLVMIVSAGAIEPAPRRKG